MSVKRYECGMTNAPTEYQSPTMHQDANGGYVSYEDYAALEARCAALAAEMAWLKKFCKDAAFDADYEAELGMERGGFTDALNNIKTPSTDAYLAEVRAQGVEMFADNLSGMNISASETSVREFAALLRKGVQS